MLDRTTANCARSALRIQPVLLPNIDLVDLEPHIEKADDPSRLEPAQLIPVRTRADLLELT